MPKFKKIFENNTFITSRTLSAKDCLQQVDHHFQNININVPTQSAFVNTSSDSDGLTAEEQDNQHGELQTIATGKKTSQKGERRIQLEDSMSELDITLKRSDNSSESNNESDNALYSTIIEQEEEEAIHQLGAAALLPLPSDSSDNEDIVQENIFPPTDYSTPINTHRRQRTVTLQPSLERNTLTLTLGEPVHHISDDLMKSTQKPDQLQAQLPYHSETGTKPKSSLRTPKSKIKTPKSKK